MSGGLSRRERKKAEQRQRIYETALRLIKAKGFDEVTVEQITEAADVGKGTFFNYFPSKMDVLRSYIEEFNAHALTVGESFKGKSSRRLLKRFFRHLIRQFQEADPLVKVVVQQELIHTELRSVEEQSDDRVFALYMRFLQVGVDSGEIREGLNLRLAAQVISQVWIGTVFEWAVDTKALPLENVFAKLDLVFDGLCSESN